MPRLFASLIALCWAAALFFVASASAAGTAMESDRAAQQLRGWMKEARARR